MRIDRSLWSMLAAWMALSAFYVVTSPESRYEADDAYDYAAAVENAELADLINPYHPIYLPMSRATYDAGRTLGVDWRALDVMVGLGALMGAAAVILFYLLLKEWFGASKAQAAFGAGALGASYGFWRYTAEAEVYVFGALAVVVLLLLAVRLPPRTLTIPVIAAAAALAFLAHSANAAALVILPFLLYGRGWRVGRILLTGLVASLLLVIATFGLYQVARDSPYSPASETSFVGFYGGAGISSSVGLGDVIPGVAVLGSAIVAGNSFLIFETVRHGVVSAFPNRAFEEELVMGATAPTWIGVVSIFTLVLVVVALAIVLWQAGRGFAKSRNSQTYLILAWISVYVGITVLGGVLTQPEIWILMLVPLWALVTNLIVGADVRGPVLLALPLALLLHSFFSGFLPVYVGEDRQADLGSWFLDNGRPGDLILTSDSAGLARYLAYESKAHSAHIGYEGEEQHAIDLIDDVSVMLEGQIATSSIVDYLYQGGSLEGYLRTTAGPGRLFVLKDVFDPPRWLDVAKPQSAAALRDFGARYADLFEPVPGADHILVRTTDSDR